MTRPTSALPLACSWSTQLAAKLVEQRVRTRDDLADLAVDELSEMTGMDAERAKKLILAARAHWFAEGEKKEAA